MTKISNTSKSPMAAGEKPLDINATNQEKLKKTQDDHWIIKERSITNREDWKMFK